MSKTTEQKRVHFNQFTISTMASNGGIAGQTPLSPKPNIQKRTIRLNLELSPTTDKSNYPEINYARLMRLEEKKRKKLKQINNGASSSEPFEENDGDVARIAAELEKKYGSSYGRGRGRSKRDDHCDIGMGYDESDSFIDNTDAYDEIIPEEVETIEGGFYINCGALEFKQLNTEIPKLRTDEIIKMPKKSRKRIISSSSSEETSESEDANTKANTNEVENNLNENKIVVEHAEESAPAKNENRPPSKKSKKDKTNATEKKSTKSHCKKNENNDNATTCSSPKILHADKNGSDISDTDRSVSKQQKSVKTTTVKDMLKAKRDSFLKMQVDGGEAAKSANGELRGAASKSSGDESSESSSEDDDSESDSDSNQSQQSAQKGMAKTKSEETNQDENTDKLRVTDTKLPELETEVLNLIQSFKELVKSKNNTGKRFQFDQSLTDIFLRIDESLLCLDKSYRNMVFAHLEYQLMLPRYFFLRKAKQLRIKEEKLKTQRSLAKLRKAVIEAMPEVIANYEVEVRKHTESQSVNSEGGPSSKMPKKKFPWNNNLRNLLYDVYQTRWISFPVLCTRKESLEDFITFYLKEKVVEIWPNGWMRYEELQKEIEKKKQASKKIKEKKSENGSSNSNSNSASSTPATTSIASASSAPSAVITTTTAISNSYAKQFEEFTMNARSCGNSDSESVASSNASSEKGLKRKGPNDDSAVKPKNKAGKFNISPVNNATSSDKSSSENVATESLITDLSKFASNVPSHINIVNNGNNINEKTNKHSNTNTAASHIIDLDNYPSVILEKPKQLQNKPSERVELQLLAGPKNHRSSSSDSDGVEIVGVFEANSNINIASKSRTKKNQQNPSTSVNANTHINNNNNNNNKISGISNMKPIREMETDSKKLPMDSKESVQ